MSPIVGEIAHGCPRLSISPRGGHLTIYEDGRAGDGLAIMHRGEITKTARECQIEPGRVTVKYGFSGRVLLGPRGKGGNITLPVNVVVTDSKREKITSDTDERRASPSPSTTRSATSRRFARSPSTFPKERARASSSCSSASIRAPKARASARHAHAAHRRLARQVPTVSPAPQPHCITSDLVQLAFEIADARIDEGVRRRARARGP